MTANAYSTEEVRILSLLATQVGFAIEGHLYLEEEFCEEHDFDEIVGRSAAIRSVLLQVETVAPTDSTVLIYGETDTGKGTDRASNP